MTEIGEIMYLDGRPHRVTERDRGGFDENGRPRYYTLKAVPVDELGEEIKPDALE
jgi:hypothetical protein